MRAAAVRVGALPHADSNLFLCGSGTHPGTGLDGRSGALAAKEILKALQSDRGSQPRS